MIRYPQEYEAKSHSSAGMESKWSAQAGPSAGFVCAIPPEFEGPGGGNSPEDFYALALLNCFVATFKVFAAKSRLDYREIEARGVLTVDRDEKGAPWMARFKLAATVSGAADAERMMSLLEKTSRSCMILNSVKTEKIFEFGVRP
jgi:organic hydroperoxide reductase OsmC/OhrA